MRFSSKTFRRRRANRKRNVRKTKRLAKKKKQRGGTLLPYSSPVPAHAAKPIAQRLDESKIVDDIQYYFEKDEGSSV